MEHHKNIHGHVIIGGDEVEKGFYYLQYESDPSEIKALFDQAKFHEKSQFQDRHNRVFILVYNRNDSTYRLEGGAYA